MTTDTHAKMPAELRRIDSGASLRSQRVFTPTEWLQGKPGVFRSWKIPGLIVGGIALWLLVSYLSHHLAWVG